MSRFIRATIRALPVSSLSFFNQDRNLLDSIFFMVKL
ncbi:hypothetical protein PS880_06287 [Pseudomonas fluorescens]|uniref:Uncharacterized protein n=1 Tax=Pseudomonas fluorescens TaxID=294 RepID=A0A5E7QHP5_PSEFL|nr:hypothetical protein PS880_06185 [Pseudomonas fluorescens]VVP61309.1 hypothetical protein PS880_06287 [Pseudomonas fluorescens]